MKPKFRNLRSLAIASSVMLTLSSAHAVDGTWNVDANGLWSVSGNWIPGIANGSTFTASFTNDITADRTVSLDSDRTLTNVVFGDSDTATAGSWILNNNAVSTNNLILAGTTPTITVNALGTGKTATISAVIQGTAGLTKSGTGTLILTEANTYTGGTTISAGTLQLGNGGSTGSIANTAITNNGSLVINRSGATQTFGVISGTGSVTLTNGTGLTLNNTTANNYSGGFTLSAGQVSVPTAANYYGFGTGLLTLNGGSMRTGNTTGNINIANDVLWNATVGFGRATGGNPIFTFNGNITLGTASAGAVTASGAEPYSLTFNGNIGESSAGYGLNLNAAGSGSVWTFNGQNTFTGALNGNSKTIVIGGSGYLGGGSYAGNITSGSFTYSSSAHQKLSGTNAISGLTTISSGTLQFAKTTALSSSLATRINVKSGATLALSVGGTGEFTTGGVTTVLTDLAASSSGTNGMNAGSNFGFDTTNASGGSFTIGNVIADSTGVSGGARGLTKLGTNTLVLTNVNTFTGATTVSAGTLLVNGSTNASSTVGVSAGATLGGTGTIGGAVNVSGVLSPGASIETLGSGTLSFANGSSLVHELDSSVATSVGSDLLKVTGNLNLTGTVGLTLSDLALTDVAFKVDDVFSIINYTGTWNNGLFTFEGNELANASEFTFGLNTWRIDYNAATGGLNYLGEYAGGSDSFVNLTVLTAVPEQSSVALLGTLGAMMLLRRRR